MVQSIGEVLEKNILLNTNDPITLGGFTQVPNFILKDPVLSVGAKITYAMFLHYAWHKDQCFPGQERLASDMGISQPQVSRFITELEDAQLIEITRRGQGKTNLYKINFVVQRKATSTKRRS